MDPALGLDTARRLDAEIREGFEYWKSLVAQVDCDAQPGGHLYTAHRQKKMAFLENESRVMREVFGYDTRMLSKDQLRERYVDDHEAVGALLEPDGVGVHPLAGLRLPAPGARAGREHPSVQPGAGLARAERRLPVADPRRHGARAARGFRHRRLHGAGRESAADNRIMPVLSNSLVTRALSPAELEAAGLKSTVFITDTRTLRFYYRLLPDGRVQIGSRSAVHGADAQNPRHLALLKAGLARKFRRCATWTWIIPGGAGWTSATT